MDHLPAPSFDPALLDMENMTAEKWYALIYNRIVQQEDTFVGDFKKKVVEIMNTCMNKPNTSLESIQQDITKTINESHFEFEHQKFIEGIVGGTYEYLCQFIIKNSMDNIKRTQCALNCFSSTNNLNYGAIKPYCNDNILLQESSKLTQIQCLPEPSNNITDADKAIQSYLSSNNSVNDENSMLIVERGNIKNTPINKMETTSFNNYRSTLQINNLSVECTNGIPMFNNIHSDDNINSAHSSVIIDDDEKTTEAIISLALKIQQTNFNFVDDFEDDDIDVSNVCTTNEIQTTKCFVEQNEDQNTDPLKLEEDFKIHNSLKLLESLVNIEHDKLEVQKSLTENEIQPNIETNEKMRLKSSKKPNIRNKRSQKLQENIHKDEEEEEWLPSSDKQNSCSKNKTKTNRSKSHIAKAPKRNKKLEVQNALNSLSTSNLSCSNEIHNDKNISLTLIGSLISNNTNKPETIVSTVRNDKSSNTNSYVEAQLAYHSTKYCLPTKELGQFPDNIESMSHDGKKINLPVSVSNSNALSITSCPVASTSGYNEKDVDIIKNKSSGFSASVMKTSDYKKLYEKDRKSLFSPDVVIIKNGPLKLSKDFVNDLHIKKENDLSPKKGNQDKKPKSKINTEESNVTNADNKRKLSKSKINTEENNNTKSDNKRKLSKPKVKVTNSTPKTKRDSKSKPNNASLKQKSTYVMSNIKFKRLKITKSDGEAKTNTVSNTNNEPNNTDILENKVSGKFNTLKIQKLNSTCVSKIKEFKEGILSYKPHNFKNIQPYKDHLEDKDMPEWLRKKCKLYNIKPLHILLTPY